MSNIDPDLNLPSKVNFEYYNCHDFHSSSEIQTSCKKSFSILNCNIRSLQANYDKLCQMQNELKYNFSNKSLSETWLNTSNNHLTNTELPGYVFISQP